MDAKSDHASFEPFAVDVSSNGSEALLVLHGVLDLSSRPRFIGALALVEDGYVRVVLDLSDLDYIDAGGIGIIDRTRTVDRKRGTELVLRSPKRTVYRALQLTHLDDAVAGHEEVLFGLELRPTVPVTNDRHVPRGLL